MPLAVADTSAHAHARRRWVVRAHPARSLSVLVIAAVAVLGALGLILAVEPGAAPAILVVGGIGGSG
jgi:hypothetical protein